MIAAAASADSGGGQPWWLGLITNLFFWVGLLLVVWIVLRLWSLSRLRLCFTEFVGGDDGAAGQVPASVLRALIRVEVHRLASIAQLPDGRPLRFDMAGPYDDQYDLGSVSDGLPPGWKQVVAMLSLLISQLGSRARVVTGMLLPRERVVLGIETIHGGVRRTETIGLQGLTFPDPQDALGNLALPAAAWIILAGYPGVTLGGTPDWKSFTAFTAGYAWQQAGGANLDQARSFYTQACQDPRNMAAAINLAALEQVDEHRDPTAPTDPLRRQSAQRLMHVARVTGNRVSEDRPEDLQWYRSRYLLSSDLRDNVDARRAAAGQAPGQEQGDEAYTNAIAREALNYAVELTIRLENKRDVLPPDFVQYGRAAALTLVARQAFPAVTGENADELAVAPEDDGEVTDATPLSDLLELENGPPKPGVAERLVHYARTYCLTDDQTDYNVMQYQRTRARIISVAFQRWTRIRTDAELQLIQNTDPRLIDEANEWLDKVQRWQEMLAEQYEIAERDQEESRARVVEAGDLVLMGHLDRPGDLYQEPDGDNQGTDGDFEFRSGIRAFAHNGERPLRAGTARLERPEERPAFLAELRAESPVPSAPATQDETSVTEGERREPPSSPSADRAAVDRTTGGRAGRVVPQQPKPSPRWRQWLRRLIGRNGS